VKTILSYSALALGFLLSSCSKEDSVKNAFSCLSGTVVGRDFCGAVIIKLDQPDPKLLELLPYRNAADKGFIAVANSFADNAVAGQHLTFNLKVPTEEERAHYSRICLYMYPTPTIPGALLEASSCN